MQDPVVPYFIVPVIEALDLAVAPPIIAPASPATRPPTTARRTGATLLYLSGVPTRQCMMLTGHTTEENFRKYIRVTKEENARMLADNPFFK